MKLTEYHTEIIKRLKKIYPDLDIELGRGDRLVVNGKIIKGLLFLDSRNRKEYDYDAEVYSTEIKRQYLDKKEYFITAEDMIKRLGLEEPKLTWYQKLIGAFKNRKY